MPVCTRRRRAGKSPRLRSGEPVAAVAAETGICQAAFSGETASADRCRVIEGTPSVEADELAAAYKHSSRPSWH